MPNLLYIESSPRKARSYSSGLAEAFLTAYQATHPADRLDRLDRWATDLPRLDGEALNAKYSI